MSKTNPILVIYKNKVLLTCSDHPYEHKKWGFIGEESYTTKSGIKNAGKELRHVTELSASNLEGNLLPFPTNSEMFYVKLTDSNVNSIVRRDGVRLEFYTLSEISKLDLSETASSIISNFNDDIALLTQS